MDETAKQPTPENPHEFAIKWCKEQPSVLADAVSARDAAMREEGARRGIEAAARRAHALALEGTEHDYANVMRYTRSKIVTAIRALSPAAVAEEEKHG